MCGQARTAFLALTLGALTVLALTANALAALALTANALAARPETRNQRAHASPEWTVSVVQTTANLHQHLTPRAPLQFFPGGPPHGLPVIAVNDRKRYQQVSGFGAGLTDSSAWLIYDELVPAAREELLGRLFGPSGLDLSYLRVPIGASDFTSTGHPYSYDDMPAGQSDPQLLNFSVAHDSAYILPTLIDVLAVNPNVQIVASPWSAPPWMKANGAYNDAGRVGMLLPSYYDTYAQYLVMFIQAYANFGVPIASITPVNEPNSGTPYPGMEFPEGTEAQWIVDSFVPALNAANLQPKIFGYDGPCCGYAAALATSSARADLAGIAWHCYGGFNVMSYLHTLDPTLNQVVSECSPGVAHYAVPEMLIGSLRNWATEVSLWNVALDPAGGPVQQPNLGCPHCTGLVTIDENSHTLTFGRTYYQLGQVSSFVQPGAWRVSSNHFVGYYRLSSGDYGVSPGLDDAAFVNPDGSRVLVAYNNSRARIRFAVGWHRSSFVYALPARAAVTFVWDRAGAK